LLDEGYLGGVALDVFENESAVATGLRSGEGDFPLLNRPNVILTPHNAFNTGEAVERKSEQSAQQVVHFLGQGVFRWKSPTED
jgi:D-lactate dehydrogenase